MNSLLTAIVLAAAAASVCQCTSVLADTQGTQGVAAASTPVDVERDREQIRKFMSMMDNMDLDKILTNTRLMTNHVKCFLDEGPCTSQTKDMKKMLPMLIKDSCSTCTKEQKRKMKKTIDTVKALRPNDYKKLTKFFDPEGKYEKKFMDNLNESE